MSGLSRAQISSENHAILKKFRADVALLDRLSVSSIRFHADGPARSARQYW